MSSRFSSRSPRRLARGPLFVLLAVALAAALLLVLGRGGWSPALVREPPRRADSAIPADGLAVAEVRRALETIRVEPERRGGYRREDWPHWQRADGCINVRERVLIAESREPAALSPDGCTVIGGLWLDPYTGQELRDPRRVDIDHVVALEEAHQSGGHEWDRRRRAAFANDLDDPRMLVAVSAEANRAKGAKGPEEWLPPNRAYLCRYVDDWVLIKARWRLTMDESERVAVGNILNACARGAETAGPP